MPIYDLTHKRGEAVCPLISHIGQSGGFILVRCEEFRETNESVCRFWIKDIKQCAITFTASRLQELAGRPCDDHNRIEERQKAQERREQDHAHAHFVIGYHIGRIEKRRLVNRIRKLFGLPLKIEADPPVKLPEGAKANPGYGPTEKAK